MGTGLGIQEAELYPRKKGCCLFHFDFPLKNEIERLSSFSQVQHYRGLPSGWAENLPFGCFRNGGEVGSVSTGRWVHF